VRDSWNHNVHYYSWVLKQVPPGCKRALDVGCGRGMLTQRLAERCEEVVGIDKELELPGGERNITFIQGDVLTEPLQVGSFDFIVAVASLHHLPLREGLERFKGFLRPGGVLVIVGLYDEVTPIDYVWAALAMPLSRLIRMVRGEAEVGAPLQDPRQGLREIRRECAAALRGSVVRRRLFFRYSVVWRLELVAAS